MPLAQELTNKLTVSLNPNEIVSWEDIKKYIEDETAKQADRIMINADTGKYEPADAFAKEYKDRRNAIFEYLIDRVSSHISATLLDEAMNKMYQIVEEQRVKDVIGNYNIYSPKGFAKTFGLFVEHEWFGLPKNFSNLADLEGINVEIKTKAALDPNSRLHVGDISVNNLPSELALSNDITNMMAMYKMISKMQNFLLIKTKQSFEKIPHSRKTIIEEISLHMVLIIKELYKMLYEDTRETFFKDWKNTSAAKPVFVEGGSWEDGKASYSISINMNPAIDKLAKGDTVYRWIKLYLYHENLLKELEIDSKIRGNFFVHVFNKGNFTGQ